MIRHPKYLRGNIYLSGGMQHAENLGAGWRKTCSDRLKEMKYFPLDICELDRMYAAANGELLYQGTDIGRTIAGSENELQAKSNIRRHFVYADLKLIEEDSDAVIVLYDNAARLGAGTISECQHAFNMDIPILLVTTYEDWQKEVPGWLQAISTRIFPNFEDMYDYFEALPFGIMTRDRYGNQRSDKGTDYLCSLCGNAFHKNKHHFVSKVSPQYCSSCVDLVCETHEELQDRYDFFINELDNQVLAEKINERFEK